MSETRKREFEESCVGYHDKATDDEDDTGEEDDTQYCYCSETTEWQKNDIPICDLSRGCRRLISHGYDGEKLYVSDSNERKCLNYCKILKQTINM